MCCVRFAVRSTAFFATVTNSRSNMSNTERMIEMVWEHPILYDISHEDYKNCRKKDKIWTVIADELGKTNCDDVKKKWKNLRDTYAKYIRGAHTKKGQSACSTKKWLWADQMEAFRPFLNLVSTTSNISNNSVDTSRNSTGNSVLQTVGLEYQSQPQHTPESINGTDSHTAPEDDCLTSEEIAEPSLAGPISTAGSSTNHTQVAKRNKRTATPVPSSSVKEIIKYLENKRKIPRDAIDSIFLAHAKTVKTFSLRRQARTKLKLAQLIAQEELLHLKEVSSRNNSHCNNNCSNCATSSFTSMEEQDLPVHALQEVPSNTNDQLPDLQVPMDIIDSSEMHNNT